MMNKSKSLTCAGLSARLFVGLTAVLVSVVVTSLHGCACPAIGCSTGATLSIDVPDDVTIPNGTAVTACFNDTCVAGTVDSTAAVLPGTGRGITFPPGSGVSGIVWTPGTTGRDRVEMEWTFAADERLQAGDRYSAMLIDPAGAIIATKEAAAASYSTLETCGPTCHRAQFP
jgi:hypothetical protein